MNRPSVDASTRSDADGTSRHRRGLPSVVGAALLVVLGAVAALRHPVARAGFRTDAPAPAPAPTPAESRVPDPVPVPVPERADDATAADAMPGENEDPDAALPGDATGFGPFERIYVIPIAGTIDGGLATSIERRVEQARVDGADCIVFDIDTYGGEVFAAEQITDLLFPLPPMRPDEEGVHTVAYVSEKAISAGALIAFSCRQLFMKRGTRLGDCEPITLSAGSVETLPEKFQSPLRAKFRTYAQRNGWPVAIAEAMVTKELGVVRIRFEGEDDFAYFSILETKSWDEERRESIAEQEFLILEGQLPTFNALEMQDLGLSSGTVRDRDELLDLLAGGSWTPPGETGVLEISWSEELVRFLQAWKFLFFIVGVIGLYLEFKSPGFGAPGIVGVLALALVFGSSYLSGLAEVWEILVFFAGVVLLAVEIFVFPGFGIPGVLGLLLILTSFYLATQPFIVPGFDEDSVSGPFEMQAFSRWVLQFAASLVAIVVVVSLLARWLPKTTLFGRLILEAAPSSGEVRRSTDDRPAGPAMSGEGVSVGDVGTSVSPLRPAGRARFGNRTADVVTEGAWIDRGDSVEVVRVAGRRVVVRKVIS